MDLNQPGKRNYATFHHLDLQQILKATVVWNGQEWKVTVGDTLMEDCCYTIEEAYSVAEKEIARRFPAHTCHDHCRPWHPNGEMN